MDTGARSRGSLEPILDAGCHSIRHTGKRRSALAGMYTAIHNSARKFARPRRMLATQQRRPPCLASSMRRFRLHKQLFIYVPKGGVIPLK